MAITVACNPSNKKTSNPELQFVSLHQEPVIGKTSKGVENNKFGFEGGTAHKVNGKYYIFSTEVFDNPKTSAVRLSQWESTDGIKFTKIQELAETNYNWNDTTYNMSPWSPMCVYDAKDERWNIFYVGYKRKPKATDIWNMSGRIRRLVASKKGIEGITSTYLDKGLIDMPGPADKWEGPAEIVSFYPYQVGNEWFAFYGSNTAPEFIDPLSKPQENNNAKILFWVGLAKSNNNGLSGKWERLTKTNPVLMDPEFMENPIVTKVNDSLYIAIYDGGNKHEISYAVSKDGLNWGKEKLIALKNVPKWLDTTRTPLCLINEGEDNYTIYFTAFDSVNPENTPPLWHDGFGNVGMLKVKLVY
jgi:hypothetical protein